MLVMESLSILLESRLPLWDKFVAICLFQNFSLMCVYLTMLLGGFPLIDSRCLVCSWVYFIVVQVQVFSGLIKHDFLLPFVGGGYGGFYNSDGYGGNYNSQGVDWWGN